MYTKKVEYLKGLMAGLPLDPNTNEYKLFTAIVDALDAFSGILTDIEEDVSDLEDTLDGINDEIDAIGDLMEALSEFDDDEDNIRPFPAAEGGDDDDDGENEYEVTCPGCKNVFIVDEDTIFKGKAVCPACKEKLAFDLSGGCGCGACHEDGPISSDE